MYNYIQLVALKVFVRGMMSCHNNVVVVHEYDVREDQQNNSGLVYVSRKQLVIHTKGHELLLTVCIIITFQGRHYTS